VGAFGTTAITAVTAQNLSEVTDVAGLPATIVKAQIAAVCAGFPVTAVKTGMLWDASIVRVVAHELSARALRGLVVDPVMVATSGHSLLKPDAVRVYRDRLLPQATLITPNLDEAALLLDVSPIDITQMEDVTRELGRRFRTSVLLKGGHLPGDPVDMLWEEGQLHRFRQQRQNAVSTHGSGCILSALIAGLIAHGLPQLTACRQALELLQGMLARPIALFDGKRLANVDHSITEEGA